jgi:hypothetical protein
MPSKVIKIKTIPFHKRINCLEKELHQMLKNDVTKKDIKLYKDLRNKLEYLRGDWKNVPNTSLPSSPSVVQDGKVVYFPETCKSNKCPYLPAGSDECKANECV